jgi:hypothetical protein
MARLKIFFGYTSNILSATNLAQTSTIENATVKQERCFTIANLAQASILENVVGVFNKVILTNNLNLALTINGNIFQEYFMLVVNNLNVVTVVQNTGLGQTLIVQNLSQTSILTEPWVWGPGAKRASNLYISSTLGVGNIYVYGSSDLKKVAVISLGLGGDLYKSEIWSGNLLPIEVVYNIPTNAPPGNKGVVFYVDGGVSTVYVWDSSTLNWLVA